MATDWRKSVSFSDRLGATSKMQVSVQGHHLYRYDLLKKCRAAAYKSANPDCQSADASQYARSSEETARKHALSLVLDFILILQTITNLRQKEYHELCAKTIQLLMSSAASQTHVEDHHVEEHIFPNLPTTGAHIGKYTNAEHFNDGLFSEVFRAADPDTMTSHGTPRVVALKITTPAMEQPPHDSQKEARILSAAKGDCIVPLLETFQQAGGRFIMVFPYMPHGLDLLLHRHQLTPESCKTILRDLFRGLKHLHGMGIIHRDIKPANILLPTPLGPAYIADFGIAWSASDSASEPADQKITDVGTTCYRPPELLFGSSSYNEKLDIWAAGCVAAQLVSLHAHTLFDAGDLGSELALIKSIFETLGTPDEQTWPEASKLPDWGKMNFKKYEAKRWEDILPSADNEALDLVRHLVVYESAWRLSADDVDSTTSFPTTTLG